MDGINSGSWLERVQSDPVRGVGHCVLPQNSPFRGCIK